jgi:hypothetical protein
MVAQQGSETIKNYYQTIIPRKVLWQNQTCGPSIPVHKVQYVAGSLQVIFVLLCIRSQQN